MKKITIASYLLIILVLAAATVVEKFEGSDTAYTMIYSSLWFKILWGVLVAESYVEKHTIVTVACLFHGHPLGSVDNITFSVQSK